MSSENHSALAISRQLDAIIDKKRHSIAPELILLGVLAGLYIGFGAMAATTVGAFGGMPVGLTKVLAASVFCVGLILVIIPGSELFTGNILMAAGLVGRKVSFGQMMRNWLTVYVGNFGGSVLLALAVFASGGPGTVESPSPVGRAAAHPSRPAGALLPLFPEASRYNDRRFVSVYGSPHQ